LALQYNLDWCKDGYDTPIINKYISSDKIKWAVRYNNYFNLYC
jgi:hypothetical protein